jgi:hypothetical protein
MQRVLVTGYWLLVTCYWCDHAVVPVWVGTQPSWRLLQALITLLVMPASNLQSGRLASSAEQQRLQACCSRLCLACYHIDFGCFFTGFNDCNLLQELFC